MVNMKKICLIPIIVATLFGYADASEVTNRAASSAMTFEYVEPSIATTQIPSEATFESIDSSAMTNQIPSAARTFEYAYSSNVATQLSSTVDVAKQTTRSAPTLENAESSSAANEIIPSSVKSGSADSRDIGTKMVPPTANTTSYTTSAITHEDKNTTNVTVLMRLSGQQSEKRLDKLSIIIGIKLGFPTQRTPYRPINHTIKGILITFKYSSTVLELN